MLVISLVVIFAMFAVMVYDISKFIIPNWLVGGLLLLYPVAVVLAPVAVAWPLALLGMLGVFVIGYALFALGLMGGGDIKLIIVLSLWVGFDKLGAFGFAFALLGGVASIVLLILRKILSVIIDDKEKLAKLPRVLRNKEPVPYGVAIAGAFLWLAWRGEVATVVFPQF